MNKLKLKGLNNIGIESIIEGNCDYLVSLRASADGVFQPQKLGDEEVTPTFHLRVINVEQVLKIGDSKPLKITQGSSPSKRLRMAILNYAALRKEADPESFYEAEMKKILEHYQNKNII